MAIGMMNAAKRLGKGWGGLLVPRGTFLSHRRMLLISNTLPQTLTPNPGYICRVKEGKT